MTRRPVKSPTLWLCLLVLLAAIGGRPVVSWAGEETARAQRQLLNLGFNPGPVDGLMGPRTRAAIEGFQRERGLTASGRLDRATLDVLFAPAPQAPAPVETQTEVPPESPPPKPALTTRSNKGARLLSYESLGWTLPQGGPDAFDRFQKNAGSPEMARSTEELIVPQGDGVYLIAPGERIPGFDCEPAKGRIEMELMLGVGGPVVFRALDKQGYCKLGFGILLEVGQRIRIVEAAWGEDTIPGGVVEVDPEGLRYLSVN